MTESKSIFKSKTAIVNAVIALAPLYPPAMHWIQANPALTLQIIVGANFILRLVTKKRVSLFGSDA